MSLNAHRSVGPDGIHSKILKKLASLSYFSIVLESGEVPLVWKVVNLIPVFKKGKKEDLGNYRPVSLTSVPGKIREIVLGVIEKHFRDRDSVVIVQGQHGIVEGKPCLTTQYPFMTREKAVDAAGRTLNHSSATHGLLTLFGSALAIIRLYLNMSQQILLQIKYLTCFLIHFLTKVLSHFTEEKLLTAIYRSWMLWKLLRWLWPKRN